MRHSILGMILAGGEGTEWVELKKVGDIGEQHDVVDARNCHEIRDVGGAGIGVEQLLQLCAGGGVALVVDQRLVVKGDECAAEELPRKDAR